MTSSISDARVLSIVGSGRSGSTLLARMLGEIDSFLPVGELRYLWSEALGEDRLCGCGVSFRRCPFWIEVGQVAFGGWDRIDIHDVIALEQRVARQRHLLAMRVPSVMRTYSREFNRFTHILRQLYRALNRVGGGRIVVDSTKDPAYASVLHRSVGIDVRVVHLVRDSRGVAFSWDKVVPMPDAPAKSVYMPRFGPVVTAIRWLVYNAAAELVVGRDSPNQLVRYEDLVADPRSVIARAAAVWEVVLADRDLAFVRSSTLSLGSHHTVAGNPMRSASGDIELRLDEDWKTEMDASDRWLVTTLTSPLLRRYGYPR